MRRRLASLLAPASTLRGGALSLAGVAGLLGGCSWLYDSEKLPGFVPPDAAVPDANPDELSLSKVEPAELIEGYGDGGSRPALLVLEGDNFSPDMTVEILRADDLTPLDGVTLDVEKLTVDARYRHLAVPVTVTAGKQFAPGTIPLKVRVSKNGSMGAPVTASFDWTLRGLPELDMPGQLNSDTNARLYSRVDITGTVSVIGTRELVVRSTSTLKITGAFNLSGAGRNAAVAGGSPGGGGGSSGQGLGGGLAGNGADGGGGGFATPGYGGPQPAPAVGDDLITRYATNRSSGGGGGGVLVVGALGGAGGGSGGSIELSARGELTIGDVTVNGGNGAAAVLNLGDGGGGTGGVIIVRSGVKAKTGQLSAAGGGGGDNPATNNRGSVGRIRIDTPELETGPVLPAARRGAAFAIDTPLVVTEERLQLRLLGSGGAQFQVRYLNGEDQPSSEDTVQADFQGSDSLTVTMTLQKGFNRLCTTPANAMAGVAYKESTNCLDVAYIQPD